MSEDDDMYELVLPLPWRFLPFDRGSISIVGFAIPCDIIDGEDRKCSKFAFTEKCLLLGLNIFARFSSVQSSLSAACKDANDMCVTSVDAVSEQSCSV